MSVIIDGTTGIDTVQDGVVTDGKLSLTANSQEIKDSLNATGSAPIYACRAWVNFNGQGTIAIRASGNVSSITDLGNGQYRVNFTTSMPDSNYAITTDGISAVFDQVCCYDNPTTSGVGIKVQDGIAGTFIDISSVSVVIHR